MRKRYDASFKARVTLEAIRGDRTMAELAAAYGVHLTFLLLFAAFPGLRSPVPHSSTQLFDFSILLRQAV